MHRRTVLAGGLALATRPALAAMGPLARLNEWRTHAIMRHAIAPGTGDPDDFDLDDCATQRNLSNLGRRQAQKAGEVLREAGVSFDRVLSSRWCRCLDTARLLDMGAVEEEPSLDSFFTARERAEAQTRALVETLTGLAPDVTTMLVTHFVNIGALLGENARSGEIFVFRLSPAGETTVLGSRTIEV
jgi:phosphohistidine phosphatase SixA